MVHHLFLGAWYNVASYTICPNSGCASIVHQIGKLNLFCTGLRDWLESNIFDESSTDAIVDVDITEEIIFRACFGFTEFYIQAAIWVYVETYIVNRINLFRHTAE